MIGQITQVWTDVMGWITDSLASVQEVFYAVPVGETEAQLTFLGVLAVVGVAIGIAFLLIGVIQNFLHLRG